MACGVVEIASGVGLVWVRRDGVGVVVAVPVAAAVPGVVGVPSTLSVLTALVPVDVAVLPPTVSAVVFVLLPSLALPASPGVPAACDCCSAVARGCRAFAMAALGIVAPTMDAHAIAQSR